MGHGKCKESPTPSLHIECGKQGTSQDLAHPKLADPNTPPFGSRRHRSIGRHARTLPTRHEMSCWQAYNARISCNSLSSGLAHWTRQSVDACRERTGCTSGHLDGRIAPRSLSRLRRERESDEHTGLQSLLDTQRLRDLFPRSGVHEGTDGRCSVEGRRKFQPFPTTY